MDLPVSSSDDSISNMKADEETKRYYQYLMSNISENNREANINSIQYRIRT